MSLIENMNNGRILEKFQPLQFGDKVADTDAEGFGNSSQRFDCNLVFRTLDVSDVIPRQIRFFRQFFLAQTSLDPLGADSFTENFGYFAALPHNAPANQENPQDGYQAYLAISPLFRIDTLLNQPILLPKLGTGSKNV
jgi:hypothetical protein